MYKLTMLEQYDKELVKVVCDLVFNKKVVTFYDLKYDVWEEFHSKEKENQVENVIRALSEANCLYLSTIKINNEDFRVNDSAVSYLKQRGYL